MVKPSGACQLRHDDPERFPSLAELAKMPFIGPDTLTVHIPVRRVEFVMENMMGYDHVIADESFIKPLQDGSIQDMKHCQEVDKVNDLIYVGRYEPVRNAKGQLAFLQRVDPRLLEGFTVHFYGANPETGLPETLERIGRERNVSVVAHAPSSKQELLAHVCRSKGQLHYAMEDDNPRAAYEGIYAGNPLFVSQESNIALELFDHPFVVKTMFHKGDINVDLAIYMEMVRGADAAFHRRIASWAEDAMVGDKVYLEMCQRIGLCAHTSESRAKLKEMTVKWEADRQRQLRLLEEEKEAVEYAEL
jgi:glycosyltransferase involved in cell wall biosynthesis